jgi:alkanesulfonate monooxygenase SsuD/methylene tetrahydromethanopterin reductase-like flavin-dependent oxidoreductase (luciferase family)
MVADLWPNICWTTFTSAPAAIASDAAAWRRPAWQEEISKATRPCTSAGERIARLSQTLSLLRERLPDTPVMVAASGPKLLTLAARSADIVAFGWPPATDLAAARDRVDLVRSAAGGRDDATGLIAVGEGEHPWLTRVGTDARTLAAHGAVTVLRGTAREMADELQRRRDVLGLSCFTVSADDSDPFATVVAELADR